MGITTTLWNSAEHLKTEEDIQLYLEACLDKAGGDSDALIHVLNVIARAKNLGQIDKNSGLTNGDELYQAIAPDGSPTFAVVAKLVNTLGFKLSIEPII
jgi:probable addiction module antidote protein